MKTKLIRLFVALALLAPVTLLRADNPPTYLFEIESSAAPGGFNPVFLTLDGGNNVYASVHSTNITELATSSRIVKFSGDGTYLAQLGSFGSGTGQLTNPEGIAVDSSNNVYVADYLNNRIVKFDSSGNYLTAWGSRGILIGQFANPLGIAVDSSNDVYVADYNNNRVEKFDSYGDYLMLWGSYGTNNGQFNGPAGIAVDSSNSVYVADSRNHRIEKFDSSGNYLTQWGNSGSGNGQFNSPIGIAVDRSNNVYVTDYGNNRVEKFDGGGNYLTQWGSAGSGNGQFSDIAGIAVDGSGNFIYVADWRNSRIVVFANNINTPFIMTRSAAFGFTNGVFGFNVIGPAGSNVVIQASTDLQTWIPLQTNLLGSGPLYFSDPQSTTNVQRFYRAQLVPAFTVGGTLTGLPAGDTVTLQDNGSDNLTLSNNGTFTFPTALPNGQTYSATVSGTSGATPPNITLMNGSGTISGANVTNVAVQCTRCPAFTGDKDLDMYNAAVSDGTAHGGVPAVMVTTFGGPFRVTARSFCSDGVAAAYSGWAVVTQVVGSNSCSSTTFPSGTTVIQFGGALVCGGGPYEY